MKSETTFYERQDYYSLKRFEDIVMLRVGKNFLFESIDLAFPNLLLDVFDDVAKNDKVKAMVIMNDIEQLGCKKYSI
jgi:hypothetical protein